MQLCPAKENAFCASLPAAAEMSVSAATITGVAFPSSRFTRFFGARRFSSQPTSPEPVNVISFTRSSPTSASPISEAGPTTTLSQPGGRPASSSSSASSNADSGVWPAGLEPCGLHRLPGLVGDQLGDLVVPPAEAGGHANEDLGALVRRQRVTHR